MSEEIKTWEEFDRELWRRQENLRLMQERLDKEFQNLSDWTSETSNRLRKEIGSR